LEQADDLWLHCLLKGTLTCELKPSLLCWRSRATVQGVSSAQWTR